MIQDCSILSLASTSHKHSLKWIAQRRSKHENKQVYNGYYDDEETAAHASDALARKLMENAEDGHKLNFPDNADVHWEEVTETYFLSSCATLTHRYFLLAQDRICCFLVSWNLYARLVLLDQKK